jgi:uncharacterized membrane protein
MKKEQKYVVAGGLVLVVLNCLILPFEGELGLEEYKVTQHLGFNFAFTPPSKEEIWKGFGNRANRFPKAYLLKTSTSHILFTQALLQLLAILIVTAGLWYLAGEDKKSGAG